MSLSVVTSAIPSQVPPTPPEGSPQPLRPVPQARPSSSSLCVPTGSWSRSVLHYSDRMTLPHSTPVHNLPYRYVQRNTFKIPPQITVLVTNLSRTIRTCSLGLTSPKALTDKVSSSVANIDGSSPSRRTTLSKLHR